MFVLTFVSFPSSIFFRFRSEVDRLIESVETNALLVRPKEKEETILHGFAHKQIFPTKIRIEVAAPKILYVERRDSLKTPFSAVFYIFSLRRK